MRLDRNITKNIEESKYLATENTWRYRTIIRVLYKSYEKMKYWLYKEEIFEALKVYDEFSEYSIEQLKSDLDSLVNWNNLVAIADTAKVNTIEEFKNREFRYQLSPITIEFERMLISLEHMKIENTATLEGTLVERFRLLLEKYTDILEAEESVVYQWWKDLNSSFKELNRNYQDYISKFYSPKNDELMKTTEFLIFKEGFIKYLRQFIKSLQINTFGIREVFINIHNSDIEKILVKVFNYEKSIQSLDVLVDEKEYKELNLGRMTSIREWFITTDGREALVEQLISNTNEIIRKITRYAAQIADKKNNNANRKEEYRRLAAMFDKCEDVKEAHILAAQIFGAFNIIKVLGNEERETESINSSIYDEEAREIELKPRVRNYREKIIKNPIQDKAQRKEEKLKQLIEKRQSEEEIIKKYIVDKVIDFGRLPELSNKDRTILLKLLSKGRSKKRVWNKSEVGLEYKIEEDNTFEHVVLKCEDGDLKMPHYKILFREDT